MAGAGRTAARSRRLTSTRQGLADETAEPRHAFDEAGTEMSWLRLDRELANEAVARFGRFVGETLAG